MEIKFQIKSRSTISVQFGSKNLIISGELTFDTPVFYAEIDSIQNWEIPNDSEKVSDEDKMKIIDFIKSNQTSTVIVF